MKSLHFTIYRFLATVLTIYNVSVYNNCSGGFRGGAWLGPPPLILDQTEARRAKKIFFLETGPPAFVRVWMTGHPPLSEGLDLRLNCIWFITFLSPSMKAAKLLFALILLGRPFHDFRAI